MAFKLTAYTDAALTTPLAGNLVATQNEDGSTPPVDQRIYIGSADADLQFEADSNPGVDQITLSIVDASPASGQEPTAVKLATSQVGLDSAVAGDPLDLGTTILSGSANAVEVWIRQDDETNAAGNYLELTVDTNTVRQTSTA